MENFPRQTYDEDQEDTVGHDTAELDTVDTTSEQVDDMIVEQAQGNEKESFFVRTKLGRLALKLVSDPIIATAAVGWGTNTFANAHNPNMLSTTMALVSVGVGTARSLAVAKEHLNEMERAELEREQGTMPVEQ